MRFVPAPPVFQPMLAVSGPIYGHEDDHAFEPKWDGWRALVSVHDGDVTVRTRTGRVLTTAVPELGDLVDDIGDHSVVLDGELVAHQGTPASFYRLGPRMATRRPGLRPAVPLTFVAFDVLWLDGAQTARPYSERRRMLEDLALQGRRGARRPATQAPVRIFSPPAPPSVSKGWWPSASTAATTQASAATSG